MDAEALTKTTYRALRLSSTMKFGKYKGKTVLEIAEDNPGYLLFLLAKMDGFNIEDPSKRYIQELYNIREHNNMMKMAYGGINRDSDWGGLTDNDIQR